MNWMIGFYWKIVLLGIPYALLKSHWKKLLLVAVLVIGILAAIQSSSQQEVVAVVPVEEVPVRLPGFYLYGGARLTLVELVRGNDFSCSAPERLGYQPLEDGNEEHYVRCYEKGRGSVIKVRRAGDVWRVLEIRSR